MSSTNGNGNSTLANLKFNTVGREDVATKVLTPQVDPAVKTRNIALGVVAFIALLGLVYVGYRQTGKDLFAPPKDSRPLAAPPHDMNN